MLTVMYNCDCGYVACDELPFGEWNKECPKCKSKQRTYTIRMGSKPIKTELVNIDGLTKEHHRYSASGGVLAEDLPDAMKLHPHITDWKKFGNSYRPLIRNRQDKLKFMKQARAYEY